MDYSAIIKSLLTKANLAELSKASKTEEKEVSSVLNTILSRLNAGKDEKKDDDRKAPDLGGIAALAGGLLGAKKDEDGKNDPVKSLLSTLLGKGSEEEVAKESGVSKKNVTGIFEAVSEKISEILKGDGKEKKDGKEDDSPLSGILGSLLK